MEYGVAKAGLLYLTKALSKDYAPAVRVNAVCPGPVWTRLWSRPGGIADQLAAKWGLDRDAAPRVAGRGVERGTRRPRAVDRIGRWNRHARTHAAAACPARMVMRRLMRRPAHPSP